MNVTSFQLLLVSLLLAILSSSALAHCEIPCGIYDDQARIDMLYEHIATIEKAMTQIAVLEKGHNANQLVRWVENKERHADALQEIVAQYFMTQRISFEAKRYGEKIGLLHQLLVYAMKCKQTTDLAHVAKLKGVVKDFAALYFEKK